MCREIFRMNASIIAVESDGEPKRAKNNEEA
jgi:hypothetical protein